MSAKHTPGPWRSRNRLGSGNWKDERSIGVESFEWIIADVCGDIDHTDEARANARLIAAAPDLLQALIDVCASNDEVAHPQWKGSPDEVAARAAIAKARGEA